ncbi:SAM-dependent methyltransferase [Methanomicrobium sp. W14]|uniref:class I SAM-dependent methyltransferase n=1 Tax=Methanomicrobium sp. W14 TaxID=2817839 RepID=UPI001AE0FD5E|nr:methyltransferase domain-containing protein [Methanomicrobium sp. W14]MBP2134396.1 SAM-dependent methyltransferase [Methanomicrobium sp. W14]
MDNNDNLEKWVECWKDNSKGMQGLFNENRTAERWNKMSENYGRDHMGDESERHRERTDGIFGFLKDAGFNPEGAKVLDVGCGPGPLSIPLAKAGASVTAVDIASGMLQRLRQEAEEENLLIDSRELSWWSADIDELGFRKNFDLVIASMTPAVNGLESFEKMMACSKNLCYYSNFAGGGRPEEDGFHSLIQSLIQQQPKPEEENKKMPSHRFHPGNGLYYPFMYLYLSGYRPSVKINSFGHKEGIKWEDAALRTIERLSREHTLDDAAKGKINDYFRNSAKDGICPPKQGMYTGMMVWKV